MNILSSQIENDKFKRQFQKEVDRRYYKPHFGPEETDEMLTVENKRIKDQKAMLKAELENQIQLRNNYLMIQKSIER